MKDNEIRQATISHALVGFKRMKYAGRKPHKTYEPRPAATPLDRFDVFTCSDYRQRVKPPISRGLHGNLCEI